MKMHSLWAMTRGVIMGLLWDGVRVVSILLRARRGLADPAATKSSPVFNLDARSNLWHHTRGPSCSYLFVTSLFLRLIRRVYFYTRTRLLPLLQTTYTGVDTVEVTPVMQYKLYKDGTRCRAGVLTPRVFEVLCPCPVHVHGGSSPPSQLHTFSVRPRRDAEVDVRASSRSQRSQRAAQIENLSFSRTE